MRAVALAGLIIVGCGASSAFLTRVANSQSPAPTLLNDERVVPRSNEKPSFDCTQAKTASARLICADAELAQLDGELGVAFQKRKALISAPDQSQFVAEQLAWIKDRNTRCELVGKNTAAIDVLASSKPCMMNAIRERIAVLGQTRPSASTPPPSIRSTGDSSRCESITDKQQRDTCFEQAGVPVVHCDHPQNPEDAAFCQQALGNRAAPTAAQKEQGPAVAACDTYAAAAIPIEQVNPSLALPACANAVRQYPNSGRLLFELGRAYYKSNDFSSAAALYQRAAYQGIAGAEMGLGFLYLNGQGVPRDYVQALLWYRRAADQGWSGAQYSVGLMYANGQGVAQDYSQAASWYRKAADQGFSEAQNNLGVLYEQGLGVAKDFQQALSWYRKAAEQGNKQAQNNLANLQAKAEINERLSTAKQKGYQPISFDDFKLDGKKLALTNGKVLMQGFYKKFGDLETLQPTGLAVATAREYGNDSGISLLTDDATRSVRALFLKCNENILAQLGCPLTVVGHADMCTITNLLGSKSVPCLVVEDGW
jgi:TPR repeat protein/uncharacterized protein YecT (DUF1311 family)